MPELFEINLLKYMLIVSRHERPAATTDAVPYSFSPAQLVVPIQLQKYHHMINTCTINWKYVSITLCQHSFVL